MRTLLELITIEMKEAFVKAGYGEELARVTLSNRPDLCEYQCNGAMAGAKKYKKAPIMIAEDVVANLAESQCFAQAEAVKPGFINLKLKPEFVAEYLNEMAADENLGVEKEAEPKTVMIDYGGPNVAKPLHVGHLRSAIIGIVVGIIPGTGGDVASYVSHNTGRMFSKEEDFGHGAREGVACCEAANNAVTGGTLIPTLTLGVPGNATTAVLLSGLTIHGLTPGYGLFTTEKQITYPFICALFIANLMMVLIGMFGAKHFAKVTLTPKNILSAFVLSLSIMGTYAVRGNLRDVVVMLVFGVIGYVLKLYKYNVVPIVLGLILGPIAEAGLSQALLLNGNSLSATLGTLFVRPICVVLMILMVISVCTPFIMEARKGKQSK